MNSYETITQALVALGGEGVNFSLASPEDINHGDYATNIAFTLSKKEGVSPKVYAEKICNQPCLSSFPEPADQAVSRTLH